MAVIGHNVGENPAALQKAGQCHIIGFNRSPASFQEMNSPCEDVPPGRHTGCGGDKVVVKQQAAPCKPFNIRRLCFCMGIINREHMPVAGIHQNQNYFHTRFLFLFAGWYSYLNYPCVIWMR